MTYEPITCAAPPQVPYDHQNSIEYWCQEAMEGRSEVERLNRENAELREKLAAVKSEQLIRWVAVRPDGLVYGMCGEHDIIRDKWIKRRISTASPMSRSSSQRNNRR